MSAIEWSVQQVAQWTINQGFGRYKSCFEDNFVDGTKLERCDAATLTQLGVRDFQDIQAISKSIRELFSREMPLFSTSIADQPWSPHRELAGTTAGYGQAR